MINLIKYKLKKTLRNKALLKVMRFWNKVSFASLTERIFTQRPFKQREIYNYVKLGVYQK